MPKAENSTCNGKTLERPGECSALEPVAIVDRPSGGRPAAGAGLDDEVQIRAIPSGRRRGGVANLLGAWYYRQLLEDTFCCFEISVALGFSLGTVISFVLNKYFTFRRTTRTPGCSWSNSSWCPCCRSA